MSAILGTDGVSQMELDEAIEWEEDIAKHMKGLRNLLFEGYTRQAWVPLGYKSWSDCVHGLAWRYGFSERHAWRLHEANRVEDLLTHGSVGEIPERQLRPLASLEPEEAELAWAVVKGTAPEGKVTSAHVQTVVQVLREITMSGAIEGVETVGDDEGFLPVAEVFKAKVTEETYERMKRQEMHIAMASPKKGNKYQHLTDAARELVTAYQQGEFSVDSYPLDQRLKAIEEALRALGEI